MSTLNVSNLAGPSSTGTAAILASVNGDALAGHRSRLINGGMVVDQRNAGASVSSSTGVVTYTVDRWYVYATGAAVTAQRIASSNATFTNAVRITGAASNTGVAFGQRIEVQNSYDLAGKTVTLSFYAASSASITLTWKAYYAGAANDFSTQTQSNTGTQATTSTLTKYSATFTLPSAATTGVSIEIGTGGAFTSGSIDITGVQLELGSVATPFERRSYGAELALCQRYFQQLGGGMTGFEEGNSTHSYGLRFMQLMRAAPTFSLISASFSYRYIMSGSVGDRAIPISINGATAISTQSAWLYFNDTSGGSVAGRGAIERFGTNYVNASAEL